MPLHPTDDVTILNFRALADSAGGVAEVNRRLGRDARMPYLYAVYTQNPQTDGKPRGLGARMRRDIEAAFNLPVGWLSRPRPEGAITAPPDPFQPEATETADAVRVPLAIGGNEMKDCLYLHRSDLAGMPAALVGAVVPDDSMHPVLDKGDRLLFDASITAPSGAGVYLVRFAPDAAPLIRRISLDLFGSAFISADGAEGRAPFDSSSMVIEGKAVYLWRGQRL